MLPNMWTIFCNFIQAKLLEFCSHIKCAINHLATKPTYSRDTPIHNPTNPTPKYIWMAQSGVYPPKTGSGKSLVCQLPGVRHQRQIGFARQQNRNQRGQNPNP